MVYLILLGYIGLTFLTSLWGRKKMDSPEAYFLAGRNVKTLTLFFTILATNFSAFYFLGFAGEAYRIGYAYYPLMAFGTAFACLSFFLIGTKVWELGKAKGLITPGELIFLKSKSRGLSTLYTTVMVVFTFPYLALQIVGAGYIVESITQGEVPYFMGASLLTLFTILYVWLGGMQSVARTDVKQGVLVILLMLTAMILVVSASGGFEVGHARLRDKVPALFERAGVGGHYSPQKWFSFFIFWLFCIPMFPQLFMRFFIAQDVKHLRQSAFLYALVPLIIALFPVVIGVFGHLDFPGLGGKEADQILPKMLLLHSPDWFAALVMVGALAAFMSTLDSQLLALGTMLTRDIYGVFLKPDLSLPAQVRAGRVAVVLLAVVGLAIAYQPFDTIFDMGKLAFAGLSVLFPLTLALLRVGPVYLPCAVASILMGEGLLLAFFYGWLPQQWLGGFEAFMLAILQAFLWVGLGLWIEKKRGKIPA
ncbi:MAG: sodium:solute symporter family protein [Bacteroidota bacterium]